MNDNENKKDYETPPENSPQLQSGGKDEKKKRTARLILIFIIVFMFSAEFISEYSSFIAKILPRR